MPGLGSQLHERMGWLVAAVGGQAAAARIASVSKDTANNMRKPGWTIALDPAFALCQEAGVSLDWLATGHHLRPDIAFGTMLQLHEAGETVFQPGSFVQLLPLLPQVAIQSGARVIRHDPSPLAFDPEWLFETCGTTSGDLRYAYIDDDGMVPALPRGALALAEGAPDRRPRGGLYFVQVGDQLLPRRLNQLPDSSFELVADADLSWRYPLPPEHTLHRILWVARAV